MTNQEAIEILWSLVEYKGCGQRDSEAAQKAVRAMTTVESLQAELDQWKREAISDKAKLGEYKILEEQGLLHRAQFKDGTLIFHPYQFEEIDDSTDRVTAEAYIYGFTELLIGECGKDYFLTKEEAEKRLAELEDGAEHE